MTKGWKNVTKGWENVTKECDYVTKNSQKHKFNITNMFNITKTYIQYNWGYFLIQQ